MHVLLPALALGLACAIWVILQSRTGRLEDAGGARCGSCGGEGNCRREETGECGPPPGTTGGAAVVLALLVVTSWSCASSAPREDGAGGSDAGTVAGSRMLMGTTFAIQIRTSDEASATSRRTPTSILGTAAGRSSTRAATPWGRWLLRYSKGSVRDSRSLLEMYRC